MRKRYGIAMLVVLCILAAMLTACGGVNLPLGHRYGNPELTFADGKVTIKYICVDCDYTETEVRTGSTQIADGAAWDAAFQNLSLTTYSLQFYTDGGEAGKIQGCIVTEDRAHYFVASENKEYSNREEIYTLQKGDGTYITYLRSAEDGSVSLAPETDSSYFDDIRSRSAIYLSLAGMFEKFTYDMDHGRYICDEPVKVGLLDDNGQTLGEKTFRSIAVNIADGQILGLSAVYEEVDEYLEKTTVTMSYYNIGHSVVKIPQSFLDEVSEKREAYTYKIMDGKVTITGANAAVSGEITIPAVLGGCPVVAIGENAFKNCTNMTGIVIPDSITTIGNNAFLGCTALTNVKFGGTQVQWSIVAVGQTGNTSLLNATIHFSEACTHTFDTGAVAKESTCGAAGIKVYTCTLCGTQKLEYLPLVGTHSYGSGVVTEEPTCKDAGIRTYTCSECGKNKTEYIPKATTHNYTNGTCTSCGADDPQYVEDTTSDKEVGGLLGAFIQLFESIYKIFKFFR